MRINLQLQTSDFVVTFYNDQVLLDDGNRIIIPQGNFKFYKLLSQAIGGLKVIT